MTPLMIASLLVMLAAVSWSVRLVLRTSDWRLRILTAMLGLVALGQALSIVVRAESLAVQLAIRLAELPQLGLSVMALLAMALLDQVVARHRRAERDLGLEQAYREELFESAPEAIVLVDNTGRVLRANSEFTTMFGYSSDEAVGRSIDELLAPRDLVGEAQEITQQVAAGDKVTRESVRRRKDGTLVPVSILGAPVKLAGGQLAVFGIYRDITTRKQTDEALRRLEKAFETMQLGLTIADVQGRIVYTNPADAAMHGYTVDELIGQQVAIFAPPGTRQRMGLEQIKEMKSWRRETVNVRKEGSVFPVQLMSDVVQNAEGEPIGIVTTCEDITERKRMEEELAHQALYDPLTELPNRAFFSNLLDRSIRRMERHEDYMFAVLYLDLDRFKVVNDSLGHTIGDQLLVACSHRLVECVRPGDVAARLGGDEFTLLLDSIKDSSDATRVAERIRGALKAPFRLNGRDVFTSASIGIALSGSRPREPEDYLRDADTAMYRAKTRGSASYEIFDEAMHARVTALLQLETGFRNALDKEEFRLFFQPLMSLDTDRIIGFEALVRWEHPERGIVLPADFIPLAEETGLIVPLGWWVLREACGQLAAWLKRFPERSDLTMSVNLSAKQFQQADLVDKAEQTLHEAGLEPWRLKLEITESVLMDDVSSNVAVIQKLHALGVEVHLDDFGTGYSSLSYLDRFEIDTLKIDRSFVSRIGAAEERPEIVHAIIGLAHDLGISVVAEGVETADQLTRLRQLRCEQVQGYLCAQPLETEAAAALLEARTGGRDRRALPLAEARDRVPTPGLSRQRGPDPPAAVRDGSGKKEL